MNIKLKSIDIEDENNKIMDSIVNSIIERIQFTSEKEFSFDVEVPTEDENLVFFVTGVLAYDSYKEDETGQVVVTYQEISFYDIVANYYNQDVDFEIIEKGRIQNVEKYIESKININC